eukprot:CFRG6597T1
MTSEQNIQNTELELDNPWISKKPEKKSANLMVALPYVYAPALPLIRIGLANRPVLRDRLFFGVLGVAFVHGVYFCKSWGYDDNK